MAFPGTAKNLAAGGYSGSPSNETVQKVHRRRQIYRFGFPSGFSREHHVYYKDIKQQQSESKLKEPGRANRAG